MKLTQEQQNVVDHLLKFDKKIQSFSGPAGSGKSTIVSHLIKELPYFSVVAYTGKAVDVLRKKGIEEAQTIHSLIYVPLTDSKGNIIVDSDGNPTFSLAKSLDCDGIIADESSMIGKEIYDDLISFNKPVIFTGDNFQLPPIGDDDFGIMKNPDVELKTIHRNAGEIAFFADFIKKGYTPTAWKNLNKAEKVKFINKKDIEKYVLEVDQIICAYNKTRVQINKLVRDKLKREGNWPAVGDKVICLKNDKKTGLFNGMQGVIEKLYKLPKNKMIFKSEDGKKFEILFDPSIFNQEKYEISFEKDAPYPFDFAYCLTAHRCQGSGFNKVMVIEQKCKLWSHFRWSYVCASRAKEELIWTS